MSVSRLEPPTIAQQQNQSPLILNSESQLHACWDTLPEELMQRILDLIYDPSSFDSDSLNARLVSRRFLVSSSAFFSDHAVQYLTQLKAWNEIEKLFLILSRTDSIPHHTKLVDKARVLFQTACARPGTRFLMQSKDTKKTEDQKKEKEPDVTFISGETSIIDGLLKQAAFNPAVGLTAAIGNRDVETVKKILNHPSTSIVKGDEESLEIECLKKSYREETDQKERIKLKKAIVEQRFNDSAPPYKRLVKIAIQAGSDEILRLVLDDYHSKNQNALSVQHLMASALKTGKQTLVNVLLDPKYNLKFDLPVLFDANRLDLLIEPILNQDIHILADLYEGLREIYSEGWSSTSNLNDDDNEEFYESAKKQILKLFTDPRLDVKANDYALYKKITEISPGLANLLRMELKVNYYEKLFAPLSGMSKEMRINALINQLIALRSTAKELSFDEMGDVIKIQDKMCTSSGTRETRHRELLAKSGSKEVVGEEVLENDKKRRKISKE